MRQGSGSVPGFARPVVLPAPALVSDDEMRRLSGSRLQQMSISSRAIRLIVAALAVSGGACDETIPVTGPSRFLIRFSGRVLDYVTQTPLSGRLVTYRRSGTGGDAPTDANGAYTLTVPGTGLYEVRIDGVYTGGTHVNGTAHRGDFFIDTTTSCISRYGVTLDSESLRPVTGAVVTLWGRSVTTNAEGWYRIDLGCATSALSGGTTIIVARHSGYQDARAVVGRGVAGVQRVDLSMERR
jgi:hypothetical protein